MPLLTPIKGSGVYAHVPDSLAKALYRLCEFRGEHVRLDWDGLEEILVPSRVPRPQDKVHQCIAALEWGLSRVFRFQQFSHIT